jgi:adenosylhomocysteine nucleosidase
MIAIFAALRQEIGGLEKEMVVEENRQEGNCRLLKGRYRGQEIVLTQTGPGKGNAERAAGLIIVDYPPKRMVCVGFAGGLKPELKGGDLVLCESLYNLTRGSLAEPQFSDKALVQLATETLRREGLRFHRGNSLTVSEELPAPRQRRSLGQSMPVDIVEMENYWLATQAARWGIPFIAVRGISDPVYQPLPERRAFVDTRGEVDRREVALYGLVHPGSIMSFLRLLLNTRRASTELAAFLTAFVDALGGETSRTEPVRGSSNNH